MKRRSELRHGENPHILKRSAKNCNERLVLTEQKESHPQLKARDGFRRPSLNKNTVPEANNVVENSRVSARNASNGSDHPNFDDSHVRYAGPGQSRCPVVTT